MAETGTHHTVDPSQLVSQTSSGNVGAQRDMQHQAGNVGVVQGRQWLRGPRGSGVEGGNQAHQRSKGEGKMHSLLGEESTAVAEEQLVGLAWEMHGERWTREGILAARLNRAAMMPPTHLGQDHEAPGL